MAGVQRCFRGSYRQHETPTVATGLERIAAKARCEPKLRFTSLAHHITKECVWENGVGPSADDLVVLFESDSCAPILSQVPAGTQVST